MRNGCRIVLFCCSMALVTAGCSNVGGVPSAQAPLDQTLEALDQSVKTPSTAVQKPIPKAVDDALQRGASVAPKNQNSKEPRFDVSVESADAASFFRAIAEKSIYNIVVHPNVTGTITLSLNNVTVPMVVDTACKVYALNCEQEGEQFIILPTALETAQFHINYLALRRTGVTRTRVSAGQSSNSSDSKSTTQGAVQQSKTSTSSEMVGSELVTEQDSRYWEELAFTLCNMLGLNFNHLNSSEGGTPSSGGGESGNRSSTMLGCSESGPSKEKERVAMEGRRVAVTPQTGTLWVRAYPAEIRDIRKFIKTQSADLRRQVVLEAKILEVNLSDSHQSGVNWHSLFSGLSANAGWMNSDNRSLINALPGQPFQRFVLSSSDYTQTPSQYGTSVTQNDTYTPFGGVGAGNYGVAMALTLSDFSKVIEQLQGQGEVQVLSSPRVATVNNQKAVIRVGTDELFVTKIKFESSTSGAVSTGTWVPEFTPYFSGIALDVTPQIDKSGEILLHIHPSVSDVTIDKKVMTLGKDDYTFPLAINQVRESDTMVRAQSGEVVVIGGLMRNSSSLGNNGLPILGALPLFGELFGQTNKGWNKTELVILLRPVLMDSDEARKGELQSTSERLRNMRDLGEKRRESPLGISVTPTTPLPTP
ncbi:MAG: secretin N-terminal domain-containing protein [Magnetococcales bacterium]|nr:secretin N-terminal domain-containing protein [Magnetococcales bacterium]MBF0438432.1 secretin N-terminal domain-containing protein [Magnetococcales bacterium]